MIINLSRPYVCRYGAPTLDRVETSIFNLRYFAECMSCNFCHDWCCSFGADVDIKNAVRIEAVASQLEAFVGLPRQEWFDPEDVCEDEEAPGGLWWRTTVKDNACVFLNRKSRGCMLHSFSLTQNADYHDLKPLVCAIFPLSFEEGLLIQTDEVDDNELVCSGDGPSLYSGVRDELLYYFGPEFVNELDEIHSRER